MNATPAPYPRLVADIGGTNARFALVEAPGAAPTHLRALRCAEHSGPEAALRAWLADTGARLPAYAAFGIATPIDGDGVAMTNHPWRFSIGALCGALGLRRLTVVNDFTALALALPALGDGDLVRVGGGEPRAGAARALIGAGTGLGVSGLLPVPGGWVPLQGEGGHVTLPASCTREAAVVAWLAARHGHVSAERVLSGPGLVVLHDTLRALDGEARVERTPAEISERALAGGCRHCVEALELFCALLGTVAGDVALTLGARGGLYIGGGIVPRLGDFFLRSAFRERFVAKGRFRPWLERIPIWVVVAPHAALTGASAALDSAIELGFTALAEPRGHVSP
ncbi:MAG: glucokinase [Proteobacteria bacterium]|jgi:glucokinase|nr:glucokinase [Pseudomonadota bacterium]HRG72607.1 glucokinase [Thauera aminoaromatica]